MISFGKSSNNLTNLTSAPARFFYFSNPHRDLPLWRRGKPGEAGPHVGLSPMLCRISMCASSFYLSS